MMKKNILSLIALTGLFTLYSCGGGNEGGAYEEEDFGGDKITAETDVKLDLVIHDIPSPIAVSKDINSSGAEYNKALLNATNKAGSYSTSYKQGLNLGIYLADLSYATVYNQTQDAMTYIGSSKSIADKLGIGEAFDQDLIKAFEANLSNKDSLMSIIDDAYRKADKFLRSNQRVSAASLVLAGGWLEGVYLTTTIVGQQPKNTQTKLLYERVGAQKAPLNNLIDLLNQFKDQADFQNLLKDMEELKATYDKIPGPAYLQQEQMITIQKKVAEMGASTI